MELLVVIGIIAILAGVALGPITSGIKKAQQNSGVQTTRTIALAEFQYANDNNQTYPYGAGAADVAKLLLSGNYINDPTIFYIGGAPGESKFTGTSASSNITAGNISYDFAEVSATAGLNSSVPDQLPVVLSSIATTSHTFPTSAQADPVTLKTSNPFGTAGIAVTYKSNSASFARANSSTYIANLCDPSFPGTTAITAPGGG